MNRSPITSSRAEAIRHDEFIRRLQNPDATPSAPAPEPEPVDPAALEAELVDLKAQWERMAWERSQGPDRGSFINEKWDDHQTVMNRLAARMSRLEHTLDGLRLKEREQSQQNPAAAQEAAPTHERPQGDRLDALETDVKQIKAVMVRLLGCHELRP